MTNTLILVESRTKARQLSKLLGADWIVEVVEGNLRNLVHTAGKADFQPTYFYSKGQTEQLTRLISVIQLVTAIYIAFDPDSAGEFLASELIECTKGQLKRKVVYRLLLSEFSKPALDFALHHPRKVDLSVAEAHLARIMADRLIGISVAFKTENSSLGYLQALVLGILDTRGNSIAALRPQLTYRMEITLKTADGRLVPVLLTSGSGKAATFEIADQVEKLTTTLRRSMYWVVGTKEMERRWSPPLSFTTTTLIQAAQSAFGYPSEQTLSIAQTLYELGLISFPYTRSIALTRHAQSNMKMQIERHFGVLYVASMKQSEPNDSAVGIYPINVSMQPDRLLDERAERLYRLICGRFVASQMASCITQQRVTYIAAGATPAQPYPIWLLRGHQEMQFDGFMRLSNKPVESRAPLNLAANDRLQIQDIQSKTILSTPPLAPFTEASLLQVLEAAGIGSPESVVGLVTSLIRANYVQQSDGVLGLTSSGLQRLASLRDRFPTLLSLDHAIQFESALRSVATGTLERNAVLKTLHEGALNAAVKVTKGTSARQPVKPIRFKKVTSEA